MCPLPEIEKIGSRKNVKNGVFRKWGVPPPKYSQDIPEKHICTHFPKSKKSASCLNRFSVFPESGSGWYFEVLVSGSRLIFQIKSLSCLCIIIEDECHGCEWRREKKERMESKLLCTRFYQAHTANKGEGTAAGEGPEGARGRSGARGLVSGWKNHFPI